MLWKCGVVLDPAKFLLVEAAGEVRSRESYS